MFQAVAGTTRDFLSWEDLLVYVKEEQKCISYKPIEDMLKKKATFTDDQYFGTSDFRLTFTEEGLKTLCAKIKFPYRALNAIEEKGLASKVLDDLLRQKHTISQLANSQFVVDQRHPGDSLGSVCGIVSDKYISYGNHSLIQDIEQLINKRERSFRGNFRFKEAYSVNTNLYLRFINTVIKGIVQGKGGSGSDKTEIGLEFRNGMAGDKSVSIDYFLHRLVCANGLILPTGGTRAKIIHTGRDNSFLGRLHAVFDHVASGLGEKEDYVNQLSDIEFSPEKLVDLSMGSIVLDIIPSSRLAVIGKYPHEFSMYPLNKPSAQQKKEKETLLIELLPLCFAGKASGAVFNSSYRDNASMFDLINVFTEHANGTPTEERIGIQKRAGEFAEWVVKNKKLLL